MDPLQNLKFVFAKTYPHIPHEYVVRKQHNEPEFLALFDAIQEHGVYEMWRGRKKKYWYRGDGWKYWTMTTDRWTDIINRQRTDEPVTSTPTTPPKKRSSKKP